MCKHTFYYFLGNKKYPEIYILFVGCFPHVPEADFYSSMVDQWLQLSAAAAHRRQGYHALGNKVGEFGVKHVKHVRAWVGTHWVLSVV